MHKLLRILVFLGAVILPAYAHWGETSGACQTRYGKPVNAIKNRDGEITAAEYSHNGLKIVIGFANGKAGRLEYMREDEAPLTTQDIFTILRAHEAESRFIPMSAYSILEEEPQAPEEHAKRLLHSIQFQSWVREDGLLVATYTRKKRALLLYAAPQQAEAKKPAAPAAE